METSNRVWVAFHDDGAWSVQCQGGDEGFDGDEGGVLGWTSL
ncbi:MAG: hypothetical protein QOI63_100 [Thermoplasmata archaeon]|jgi:hypothetical protein|nr:hypothetical protein [Thermoplasmata archaeon]